MSAHAYTVHFYDVWGNAEDGYDVNDVYPSEGEVIVRDYASVADLIQTLIRAGILTEGCVNRTFDVDGESGYALYVRDDTDDEEGQGKPLCELRSVREVASGYVDCGCRDCFEGPIMGYPGDYCDGCVKAGCEHGKECSNPSAYSGSDAS